MARLGNIEIKLDGFERVQRAIEHFYQNLTPEQAREAENRNLGGSDAEGATGLWIPAGDDRVVTESRSALWGHHRQEDPTEAEIRWQTAEQGGSDIDCREYTASCLRAYSEKHEENQRLITQTINILAEGVDADRNHQSVIHRVDQIVVVDTVQRREFDIEE